MGKFGELVNQLDISTNVLSNPSYQGEALAQDLDPRNFDLLDREIQRARSPAQREALVGERTRLEDLHRRAMEEASASGRFSTPEQGSPAEGGRAPEGAFYGPAGIPQRWRKPPTEGGTGAYFESAPKTWQEFGQNFVQGNIPQEGDTQDEQIRKVMGMIGPSSIGMLFPANTMGAPIQALKEAGDYLTKNVGSSMGRWGVQPIETADDLWRKYKISAGREGGLRYEVPDDIGLTAAGRAQIQVPYKEAQLRDLGELVDFGNYYRARPNAPNIGAKLGYSEMYRGSTGWPTRGHPEGKVYASSNKEDDILGILIHELKHNNAMQYNWQPGASWAASGMKPPPQLPSHDLDKLVQAIKDEGWDIKGLNLRYSGLLDYFRDAGEVAARNMEGRFKFPGTKLFSPQSTEIIPRALQLVNR